MAEEVVDLSGNRVIDENYANNVIFDADGLNELLGKIRDYPIIDIDYVEETDHEGNSEETIWDEYTEGTPCIKVTYGDATNGIGNVKSEDIAAIRTLKEEMRILSTVQSIFNTYAAAEEEYKALIKNIQNEIKQVIINVCNTYNGYLTSSEDIVPTESIPASTSLDVLKAIQWSGTYYELFGDDDFTELMYPGTHRSNDRANWYDGLYYKMEFVPQNLVQQIDNYIDNPNTSIAFVNTIVTIRNSSDKINPRVTEDSKHYYIIPMMNKQTENGQVVIPTEWNCGQIFDYNTYEGTTNPDVVRRYNDLMKFNNLLTTTTEFFDLNAQELLEYYIEQIKVARVNQIEKIRQFLVDNDSNFEYTGGIITEYDTTIGSDYQTVLNYYMEHYASESLESKQEAIDSIIEAASNAAGDQAIFGHKYVKVGSNIEFKNAERKNNINIAQNYGTFRVSNNNNLYEVPIKGFEPSNANSLITDSSILVEPSYKQVIAVEDPENIINSNDYYNVGENQEVFRGNAPYYIYDETAVEEEDKYTEISLMALVSGVDSINPNDTYYALTQNDEGQIYTITSPFNLVEGEYNINNNYYIVDGTTYSATTAPFAQLSAPISPNSYEANNYYYINSSGVYTQDIRSNVTDYFTSATFDNFSTQYYSSASASSAMTTSDFYNEIEDSDDIVSYSIDDLYILNNNNYIVTTSSNFNWELVNNISSTEFDKRPYYTLNDEAIEEVPINRTVSRIMSSSFLAAPILDTTATINNIYYKDGNNNYVLLTQWNSGTDPQFYNIKNDWNGENSYYEEFNYYYKDETNSNAYILETGIMDDNRDYYIFGSRISASNDAEFTYKLINGAYSIADDGSFMFVEVLLYSWRNGPLYTKTAQENVTYYELKDLLNLDLYIFDLETNYQNYYTPIDTTGVTYYTFNNKQNYYQLTEQAAAALNYMPDEPLEDDVEYYSKLYISSKQNLGSPDNYWNAVYANNLYCDNGQFSNGITIGSGDNAFTISNDNGTNVDNNNIQYVTTRGLRNKIIVTDNTDGIKELNAASKEKIGWQNYTTVYEGNNLTDDELTASIRTEGGIYAAKNIWAERVFNAVFNDYAEYRQTCPNVKPGQCVYDNDDGSLSISDRFLIPGAQVVTDTFGHAMGGSAEYQTPVAVAGRVLVYPYQDRKNYHAGMCVCAAPNGTVNIMSRKDIVEYPDCIVGVVSEIPNYEFWGTNKVKVDGRIWIKVR